MKYKIVLFIALGTLMLGGCKKFLDKNADPNMANDPGVQNVLSSAEVEIAFVLGNHFQINGGFWSQYWTQYPLANQYKPYDQYQPSSENYNRPWATLYNGALTDLKYVYTKAEEKGYKNYMAVSKLLSAYTFQMITDAWGDAPFTEALKGLEADGGITSPKYDKQSVVYDSIFALIDQGLGLIDVSSPVGPGADDLIYNGDMELWVKFGNTLKLRAAMRLSEVNPTKAAAIISSIDAGDLIGADEDAKMRYSTTGGSENPLFAEMQSLNTDRNIIASATCVNAMNNINDPRVYKFYAPLANGSVVGNTQGDFNDATKAVGKSFVGTAVGANPDDDAGSAGAPVLFISSWESYFLQAEAIARGWMVGDDHQAFEMGIDASFRTYLSDADFGEVLRDSFDGVTISPSTIFVNTLDYAIYRYINGDTLTGFLDGDSVEIYYNLPPASWAVYPDSGTVQDKVKTIITQKWLSMCGNQGFEAWSEQRRTGYPDFFVQSVNSLIGTTKPARFVYPTDEINRNSQFPGVEQVDKRVWWDIN